MNVGRFLAIAAERDSAKAGFVWGDDVVSYREANARSDSLAGALRRFGLGPGERVGVLMPNCPQLLESMFATWKAGGCVVPLNARFQREELVYHLADPRGHRLPVFLAEDDGARAGPGALRGAVHLRRRAPAGPAGL